MKEYNGVKDFYDANSRLTTQILVQEVLETPKPLQIARARAYARGYRIRLEGLTSWMAANMINLEMGLVENHEQMAEEKRKRQLELFSHAIACLGVSEMLLAGLDNDETKCYELDKERVQQVIDCFDGIRLNLSFGLKPSPIEARSDNELPMAERLDKLAVELEADGRLPMQWIISRQQPFRGMSSGRKMSDEELQECAKSAQVSQATDVSKFLKKHS